MESVGGICHSDLSHSSSSCVTAMDNDNESKLIYGRVILITAGTECKTSHEQQYFEVQGNVTYLLLQRLGISHWQTREKKRKTCIFKTDMELSNVTPLALALPE